MLQCPHTAHSFTQRYHLNRYGQAVQLTPENVLTYMHLADFYGITQLLNSTENLLDVYVTVQSANCCAALAEATSLRCTQVSIHSP